MVLSADDDTPAAPSDTYFEPQRMRSRKALRCARCRYSLGVCMCDEVVALPTRTRVLVVAHYIELHKTTNTSRLAALALSNASVRGRGHPEERTAPPVPDGKRLVLYPGVGARELTASDAADDLILVVPDGTWTQAGRVARRDPAAVGAEQVRLPGTHASRYTLRRGAREGGVCTLEALALALGILEGARVEAHLLAVFDEFQRRALARRDGLDP